MKNKMKYLFAGILMCICLLGSACTTSTPFDQANFSVDLGYGEKMDFINIPEGVFTMSRDKATSREILVVPISVEKQAVDSVEVVLSPFALGKTEVTQAQWLVVMGNSPSRFAGNNRPVECVSWDDAMNFCKKLTKREHNAGRLPKNFKFTLPTEAQWEYACRAGAKTRFSFGSEYPAHPQYGQFGNVLDKSFLNGPIFKNAFEGALHIRSIGKSEDETIKGIKQYDDGFETTAPVGRFLPNAWGLYDMHGNVKEWCLDYFDYALKGGKDPVRSTPGNDEYGTQRIVRGGSWVDTDILFACYYSWRTSSAQYDSRVDTGFRVALVKSSNP